MDSESTWDDAMCELVGRRLSTEVLSSTDGLGVHAAMRLIHAEVGWAPGGIAASAAWVERRVAQLLATDVRWRPGAAELLAELRSLGVPTALVTASRRKVVNSLPGLGGFAAVICGDDVPYGKPHPGPYRAAVRLLGVSAAHCVAIEDTVIGATSAAAAGCAVLLAAESPAAGFTWTPTLTRVTTTYLRSLVSARLR